MLKYARHQQQWLYQLKDGCDQLLERAIWDLECGGE